MLFFEKHGKSILFGSLAILVVAAIGVFISSRGEVKEKAAQEKLAGLEKEYTSYNEKRLKESRSLVEPKDEKDKKPEDVTPSVDIAQLKTKFSEFIKENQGTVASNMATLFLSDILVNEGKPEDALATLENNNKVTANLVSVLTERKKADLYAQLNKCDQAQPIWEKLTQNKEASFMHYDVKIMQALCYQKQNDLKKAEDILTSIVNDKSESAQDYTERAGRILRYLKFNKTLGS